MAEEIVEEKAYDIKDLVAKLKAEGLDIAEDAARLVFEKSMEWVEESADKSSNIIDDILVKFIPTLKGYVSKELDKIDGEDDDGDGEPSNP